MLDEPAVVDVQGSGNLFCSSVGHYSRSDVAGRSVVLKKDIWDFPKWMEMPENLEWWSNDYVESLVPGNP